MRVSPTRHTAQPALSSTQHGVPHAVFESGRLSLVLTNYGFLTLSQGTRSFRTPTQPTHGNQDTTARRADVKYNLDQFLDTYGRPAPRIRTPSASVTLTRAVHGCWLFCTSINPLDDEQKTALARRFPDYDCATIIEDQSEFAVQLGLDFGRLVRHEVVHLDTLVQLVRQKTLPLGLSVVNVYHGPVFLPE